MRVQDVISISFHVAVETLRFSCILLGANALMKHFLFI